MLANDVIVFISQQGVPYSTPLMIYVSKQKVKYNTLDVIVENGNVLCQVVQEGHNMLVKGQKSLQFCNWNYNVFGDQQDVKLVNIRQLSKNKKIDISDLKYINPQIINKIAPEVQISKSSHSGHQTKKEQFLFSQFCSYIPESSLKQLINVAVQKQTNMLNCKVGSASFRIFFYNATSIQRIALSDIDGTITSHDLCFACNKCLKFKLVNQLYNFLQINDRQNALKVVTNKEQTKKLNYLTIESVFDIYQLPLVLISARNGNNVFRFLTDKTAKACVGQIVPQINLIRPSGFVHPPHELRAAFKAAVAEHIIKALACAKNCQNEETRNENIAQEYPLKIAGFGNAGSDAIGFLTGGCHEVVYIRSNDFSILYLSPFYNSHQKLTSVHPRDLITYSNLLGDVEDAIVKNKQLRRRSESEMQDWVMKYALHKITVLDAGDLGLEDAETMINQCKQIKFLSLRGNKLTTATKIAGNFKNLLVLDLSSNNMISLGYRVYWNGLPNLRVLLLNNNQIENELHALEMLEPLQNLSRLDLFNNPIQKLNSEEQYLKSILRVLPKIQVIDGSLVSCILNTEYASNYINSEYFSNKRLTNKYRWLPRVGEDMIQQQTEFNSMQFNNIANAKLDCMMHEGKFAGNQCFHVLLLYNFELMERQRSVCPILILQSYLKMTRVKKNIETWTNNYQKNVLLIQRHFKGASVRIRHELQIRLFKTLAKTHRRIKRTYFYTVLVISSKLRDCKAKFMISNAAITLQNFIRINISKRTSPDDLILMQKPQIDEGSYTFMIARTHSTPQDCIAFIVLLARSIISQIDQTQQQYMEDFSSSMITYSHSQFQFISTRKNVIRRSFKYKAEEIIKQIPLLCVKQKIKYYAMNKQLTYDHKNYKNSSDFLIKSTIKQPIKSVINNFSINQNGNMPMCLYITVKHKELAAIFNYLTNTTVFPIYNLDGEQINQTNRIDIGGKSLIHLKLNQYSLGQVIMNTYVSRQFQATIYDMMLSSIIPSQFIVGDYRAQTYMFGLDNIPEISAALHIQKVYRALKHVKQFIIQQRDVFNFQFFSIYQVFYTVSAVKVLQKFMKARLARKQIKIIRRMCTIYKSIMRNGFILIPKQCFENILENNYKQQHTMIKHLVNLSPVVSQNYWINFFHTIDDNVNRQTQMLQNTMYSTLDYSVNRDTQVASIPYNKPELYKTMENNIMCKQDYINEGFVNVQSQKLDFTFLYSKNTLQKYINQIGFIENNTAKEILAVKLRSEYIREAKDRVLDPVSMMSLQTKANENINGNILLNNFRVTLVHGIQSNKAFNINFLSYTDIIQNNIQFLSQFLPKNGINRHKYEPKAYIPQYLWPYIKVAAQDCYIMKHMKNDVQQLALKCYILENRYFNPKIVQSDNIYNQQTLLPFEDFLITAATICIQTSVRTYQVRKKIKIYKMSIAKRLKQVAISSAANISAAAIEKLAHADAEKQFIAQMRLRRSTLENSKANSSQNDRAVKQRAQSAYLEQCGLRIKPVQFYDRFRRDIKLENMISRCEMQYQRSIRSASTYCTKIKILEHNKMLHQAVKDYTKNKNQPKMQAKEIISNLSALKQTEQRTLDNIDQQDESAFKSQGIENIDPIYKNSDIDEQQYAAPDVILNQNNSFVGNDMDVIIEIDDDNTQNNIWDEDIDTLKVQTSNKKLHTSRNGSAHSAVKPNQQRSNLSAKTDNVASVQSYQHRVPSHKQKRSFTPSLGDVYSTEILFDGLTTAPTDLFKTSPIRGSRPPSKQRLNSADVQLYANKISQLSNKTSRVQSQQQYAQLSQVRAKLSDKKNKELSYQMQKQRDADQQKKKESIQKQKIMLQVTKNNKVATQLTVSTLKGILRDQ